MTSVRHLRLSFVGLILVGAVFGQSTSDQRARDLVQKMTLDEKIEQLHGVGSPEHFRYVPPVPRLGIGALVVTNGPAGAGPGDVKPQSKATALPSPIALAATWDADLARSYGEISGAESRDLGNSLLEAPTINIARVPQNGRTFEGYGEDPFLTGQLSVNDIAGIQQAGEIADVKHYDANNQETNRFTIDEQIDERTLREIYLPAFEASVELGHSAAVMCAYPKINGTYNCENSLLMNQILKREWKFNGFITSDFGAVHSTGPSALAGLDLEMPSGKYWDEALKSAVQSGQVPMSVIDDKLIRRYRVMMDFHLFDHPPTPKRIPQQADGKKSREIAEAGIVLLKNEGHLLPLRREGLKSIALVGPYATDAVTGGGGSSHVVPLYAVDPETGIQSQAGKNVAIHLDDGADLNRAAALARAADVAIVMVGETDTEGRDHGLELESGQDELIDAVAAANPRTIVVLKTGSVVLMPWVDRVSAILEAWYPGEEDGNAVADVLFGKVNPSGRLPLTFPKKLADLPAHTPEQYPGVDGRVTYSEGIFVGYRYYDQNNIEPLFPFGYGLSYTAFHYDRLKLSAYGDTRSTSYDPAMTAEFDLTNSGERSGDEVVQVYVSLSSSQSVPEPPKELAGFARIPLNAGKTKHVHIPISGRSLSYWDVVSHTWKRCGGPIRVMIGGSSGDIRLEGQIGQPIS